MSRSLRILILEDSPADAELNIEELRRAGFDPEWRRVESEADYLAALDTSPDLVLADYSLPQFDGMSALKLLRRHRLDIPFILVSGMVGEETAVEVMKQGATDFLLKDRIALLGAAVERALEKTRLRSEKREAEAALRESESRLRLAQDAAQMGSWDWDMRTGEILWSPHHESIFGYVPGTPRRTNADFYRRLHPDDVAHFDAEFREASEKHEDFRCEYRVVWPDESIHWVSAFGRFEWDANGCPIRMVGMVQDITGRKHAEDALRHSEQFARSQWAEAEATLEAIPANIAILDAEGVIVRVNQAWSSFALQNGGFPGSVEVGTNYLEVCDAATGSEIWQIKVFAAGIRNVLKGKAERFSMEYPCHSPEQQRWFMGYVTASRGEGAARAVVAHVDITAQKRTEEQIRQLNEVLELRVIERTIDLREAVKLLETEIEKRQRLELEILEISEREQSRLGQDLHDGLGQELAGIALICKALATQLHTDSHPSAEAASNMAAYIRETIDSARRLAKGLYPIELSRYGLPLALEDLAGQTSRRFGIRCELRQQGEAPKLLGPAEIHIYRIVQECIANALKHGRAENVVIESVAGDGVHTFTVTNDGIGFETPVGNTGMGLHLMDYRARVIGATIAMEKPEEGGCRVTCRIPV